jgi:hypothetical protein
MTEPECRCGDTGCECHRTAPDVLLGVGTPEGRSEFVAAFAELADLLARADTPDPQPEG